MDEHTLQFFQQDLQALPLYEQFRNQVLQIIPGTHIKVQKSQISFYNRHMFACVSFAKVRKANERPPHYIVITFGLAHCLESHRIDAATEPYPNYWTHHMLIATPDEIDDELMGWIHEASIFSARK
ncbi:DUF5655 domain-containing protein [Flavonifractor porci]|uniref:DUF5655 domain-containing protein n=1 Tax=Flavonifractor porci TaxID=3133422 RepID=UPI00309F5B63